MYCVNDVLHRDRGGAGFRETVARVLSALDEGTLYVEGGSGSPAAEADYRRLYGAVLDGAATVVRPEDREEGAALVDPGAHAARVVDRAPDDGPPFDVAGVDSEADLPDRAPGAPSVAALREDLAAAEDRAALDDHEVDESLREALDPARAWPTDEPAVVEDGTLLFADGVVDGPTGDDRTKFLQMELVEAHADSLAEVRVEPGVADDETAGEGAVAAVLDALDHDGFVEAMAGVVARDERYADRIRADVDAGRTDPDETVVVMGGAHTLADRPRDRGFDPAVDPGREEAMSRGERAMWAVRRRTSAAVVGAVEAARERVGGLLGRDDGESGAARSETAAADEGRLVETVGDAPDDPERGAEHTADESEAGERGEPAGVSRRPRPDPPATKRAGE